MASVMTSRIVSNRHSYRLHRDHNCKYKWSASHKSNQREEEEGNENEEAEKDNEEDNDEDISRKFEYPDDLTLLIKKVISERCSAIGERRSHRREHCPSTVSIQEPEE